MRQGIVAILQTAKLTYIIIKDFAQSNTDFRWCNFAQKWYTKEIYSDRNSEGWVDDQHEASSWLTGNELRKTTIGGNVPRVVLVAIVGVDVDVLSLLDDAFEGDADGQLLIGAVDACHVPCVAAASSQYSTLTRIACHIAGVVPHVGQMAEELLHFSWLR